MAEPTDAEIMRCVIDQMDAEWEAVRAKVMSAERSISWRTELLVAHWIRIFLGEESVKSAIYGIPPGDIIDREIKRGRKVPPEIEAYRDAWWARIVANDMARHRSERHTPEGKAAAQREYDEIRRAKRLRNRRARAT